MLPDLVTLDGEGRPFGVCYELLSELVLADLNRQQQINERHQGH